MFRTFIIGLCLFAAGTARAFESGDTVVVTRETPAKVGDKVIRILRFGETLTVELVGADWLWVRNGNAAWVQKKHVMPLSEAAMPYLEQALREGETAAGHCGRALCEIAQLQLDRAAADLDKAEKLSGETAGLLRVRGKLAFARRQTDAALAAYNAALAIEPDNPILHLERGGLHQIRGDSRSALADFDTALELDANLVPALLERADSLREMQRFDRAIADCDRAIKLQPMLALGYAFRASCLRDRGNLQEALSGYQQALQIDPRSPIALLERGLAYQLLGDYRRAIEDYRGALANNPKLTLAYNDLAWILATCPEKPLRDGKKAIEYANKACELADWKRADQLDTLAAAYAEAGDFDHAIKTQSEAIRLAGSPEDEHEFKDRLQLYQRHEPYRDKTDGPVLKAPSGPARP